MRRTLYRYSIPFKQGGQREGILMRLESKKGDVGWGEIAPLPGFSAETLEEAIDALKEDRFSLYPSVQWGHAAALLDLSCPLTIDSIPVRTLETDKIKIGDFSLKEAIEKVEKTPCSGVDINQKWSLDQALALAKACPKLQYFEEPLKVGENTSLFPYPVALDESLRQKNPLSYPWIKMHTIKPSLHGYPLPNPIKGIDFILSSSYESPLGLYQIAKLAFRLNLPLIPMGLGTVHLFSESLFEETCKCIDGLLFFPQTWTLKANQVEVLFDGSI